MSDKNWAPTLPQHFAPGTREKVWMEIACYGVFSILNSQQVHTLCNFAEFEPQDNRHAHLAWQVSKDIISVCKEVMDTYDERDLNYYRSSISYKIAFTQDSLQKAVAKAGGLPPETNDLETAFSRTVGICIGMHTTYWKAIANLPLERQRYYASIRFAGYNQLRKVREILWRADGTPMPNFPGSVQVSDFVFGAGFFRRILETGVNPFYNGLDNLPSGEPAVIGLLALGFAVLTLTPILYFEMQETANQPEAKHPDATPRDTLILSDIRRISSLPAAMYDLSLFNSLAHFASCGKRKSRKEVQNDRQEGSTPTISPHEQMMMIPHLDPFDFLPFVGIERGEAGPSKWLVTIR